MKISELIERLGRTVFEAPFGAMSQAIGDSPEVAEIRIAVLDEVKKKIQRAGGKCRFPDDLRVEVRVAGDESADEDNWLRIAVAHALLRAASALLPTHGCSE
jgi:hypothetical protein